MRTFKANNGTFFIYNPDLSEVYVRIPNENISDVTDLLPRNEVGVAEKGIMSQAIINGSDLQQFINSISHTEDLITNDFQQAHQHISEALNILKNKTIPHPSTEQLLNLLQQLIFQIKLLDTQLQLKLYEMSDY